MKNSYTLIGLFKHLQIAIRCPICIPDTLSSRGLLVGLRAKVSCIQGSNLFARYHCLCAGVLYTKVQLPKGKFKLIMTIKLSIYILKNRYTLLVEKNVKIIVGKSERRRPGRLGFENLNAPGQGEF